MSWTRCSVCCDHDWNWDWGCDWVGDATKCAKEEEEEGGRPTCASARQVEWSRIALGSAKLS